MNVTQTNHTTSDMTEQIQDIIASLGIEIIESSVPNEDNSYTTQLELKDMIGQSAAMVRQAISAVRMPISSLSLIFSI